jgi:hypothetical protein
VTEGKDGISTSTLEDGEAVDLMVLGSLDGKGGLVNPAWSVLGCYEAWKEHAFH